VDGRGDAYAELGDTEAAAALYRRAAETLQDFHF
jgi:predicted negative regulator of RcsB-dependent stress response